MTLLAPNRRLAQPQPRKRLWANRLTRRGLRFVVGAAVRGFRRTVRLGWGCACLDAAVSSPRSHVFRKEALGESVGVLEAVQQHVGLHMTVQSRAPPPVPPVCQSASQPYVPTRTPAPAPTCAVTVCFSERRRLNSMSAALPSFQQRVRSRDSRLTSGALANRAATMSNSLVTLMQDELFD
jgi:hypothetical protein